MNLYPEVGNYEFKSDYGLGLSDWVEAQKRISQQFLSGDGLVFVLKLLEDVEAHFKYLDNVVKSQKLETKHYKDKLGEADLLGLVGVEKKVEECAKGNRVLLDEVLMEVRSLKPKARSKPKSKSRAKKK